MVVPRMPSGQTPRFGCVKFRAFTYDNYTHERYEPYYKYVRCFRDDLTEINERKKLSEPHVSKTNLDSDLNFIPSCWPPPRRPVVRRGKVLSPYLRVRVLRSLIRPGF